MRKQDMQTGKSGQGIEQNATSFYFLIHEPSWVVYNFHDITDFSCLCRPCFPFASVDEGN